MKNIENIAKRKPETKKKKEFFLEINNDTIGTKGLLIDNDGTLGNEEIHDETFKIALLEFCKKNNNGHDFYALEEIVGYFKIPAGLNAQQSILALNKEFNLFSEKFIYDFLAFYSIIRPKIFKETLEDFRRNGKNILFPDSISFLENLGDTNYPAVLVTSTLGELIEIIDEFEDKILSNVFQNIVSGGDKSWENKAKKSKPNADPYILGASFLGLKPKECTVIEDSLTGINSAKNAKSGEIIAVNREIETSKEIIQKTKEINGILIKTLNKIIFTTNRNF